MTAQKSSNRTERKAARRKLLKGLTTSVHGSYKMAKIRRKK